MKLQCQIEVVNRLHSNLNLRSSGKYLKSILALGKEPKCDTEFFVLHFSSVNKSGTKYRIQYLKQVFKEFINDGKVTLRFEDPPHDLCIKSEAIQLKCFMRTLQQCVKGDTKNLKLTNLSNISVTAKDVAPAKLVIKDRSEFPSKGLPRTLESLTLAGLKMCNFRRDILLLRHLVVLDLSNNEIEKIPPEFGRMPNISELYLGNNQLGIKDDIDWRWLSGPQITKSLKLLDLSGNKLKCLPKSMWTLERLVTLKVDNNLIEKLPSTLGRMSTLRYLTASQNKMETLPSGLMHCRLEYIDISANKFQRVLILPTRRMWSPWNIYVGSLANLAAKAVLKNKIYYAPNLIPWTLVEFLDDSHMCVCGLPVVNGSVKINKIYNLKDFFQTVVFDNRTSNASFECYFCSLTCYTKVVRRLNRARKRPLVFWH